MQTYYSGTQRFGIKVYGWPTKLMVLANQIFVDLLCNLKV